MRVDAVNRSFSLVKTEDQWLRSSFDRTMLEGEVVSLAWVEAEAQGTPDLPAPIPGGLAFDRHCRLYHSVPDEGRLERLLWAAEGPQEPSPVDLIEPPPNLASGDFRPVASPAPPLVSPRGVAVDDEGYLLVAETGLARVLVYDLWNRRLMRRVALSSPPVDLCRKTRSILALSGTPPTLWEMGALIEPRELSLPPAITRPSRLAVCPLGLVFVLDEAGTAAARIVPLHEPENPLPVPFATDIEFVPLPGTTSVASDQTSCAGFILVVARRPGQDFLRFRISRTARASLSPLKARSYDGRGIVATPDGRIGFWTPAGFRHAVSARIRYQEEGHVFSFRLDSGQFQTIWGRLFLEAHVPEGTDVRLACVTADEVPAGALLERRPPANIPSAKPKHDDLSPPMPPVSLTLDSARIVQPMHRRDTGRESGRVPAAGCETFATYEAPVMADAGRYLWVTLKLTGNTRVTPRIRTVRAEYPSHDLLRRLPKIYSRDQESADFLRRYLTPLEGIMAELDRKAAERDALLSPCAAPREVLPWLAGFVGLVLDERLPVERKRMLIAEAVLLFRFRGTFPGLKRMLELATGASVILVEQHRLRGHGGAIIGGEGPSAAVVGAGLRVGGRIRQETTDTPDGSTEDAYRTHAHRFTVILRSSVNTRTLAMVEDLLATHRPAHTLYDLCTVDGGMRVGRGLHVGLTSIIGPSAGFVPLEVGHAALGRHAILGRPRPGTRAGSRLGVGTRIG